MSFRDVFYEIPAPFSVCQGGTEGREGEICHAILEEDLICLKFLVMCFSAAASLCSLECVQVSKYN